MSDSSCLKKATELMGRIILLFGVLSRNFRVCSLSKKERHDSQRKKTKAREGVTARVSQRAHIILKWKVLKRAIERLFWPRFRAFPEES